MIYILNIRAKSTIVIIFALFTLGTNLILLILYERKFYAYACLAHIFVRVYPCHHASMRHHISTTFTLHPAPFSYLILQLHIVLKTHACKLIVLMEPFSKHYYSIKSVRVRFHLQLVSCQSINVYCSKNTPHDVTARINFKLQISYQCEILSFQNTNRCAWQFNYKVF